MTGKQHEFTVIVTGCSAEQATRVLSERLRPHQADEGDSSPVPVMTIVAARSRDKTASDDYAAAAGDVGERQPIPCRRYTAPNALFMLSHVLAMSVDAETHGPVANPSQSSDHV